MYSTDIDGWGPDCAHPVSGAKEASAVAEDHMSLVMVVFASLFGAMHFITWSFSMPTVFELWMWRFASIALTSLPIIGASSVLAASSTTGLAVIFRLLIFLFFACGVIHPLIRLAIVIDSVVLLRDLTDTAFLVLLWSDAIPSL